MANIETPRVEHKDWKKSKELFLNSIDKNKSLPEPIKMQLKEICREHFNLMGKAIYTAESIMILTKN